MRAGERAYRELRADIVSWRLTPGQVLGEVDLSERLGISRTPVREALSRLTAYGLTEPHNGRGVVVSAISSEDVRALYEPVSYTHLDVYKRQMYEWPTTQPTSEAVHITSPAETS